MIEPNELRIGNIFHPAFESNGIIIPAKNILYKVGSIDKFGEIKVIAPHDPVTHVFKYGYYFGVPIIEESFLKFGFERILGIGIEAYRIKTTNSPCEFMLFKDGIIWRFGFDQCQSHVFSHFKYIHQLQNLYFALTGEELIFND